ncbi:MAG: LptA/OstA family protein [Spirochaetaceae bacterium]|nr:LptA/OstA family protein [Spirochaetaceae bacterium]
MRKKRTMRAREAKSNAQRSGLVAGGVLLLLLLKVPGGLSADVFTFRADKMAGGKATGREAMVLTGNAQVKSDSIVLKAERIELRGADNDIVECYGNVTGYEEEKDIHFRADNLLYDRKTKVAKLTGNATLEDKKNEIVAHGRYIEYDDDKEIAIFQISVRLFRKKMVCRSEYAIYRRLEEILDLSGFPIVYKESDEFRADKIRVDLDTDDVIMTGAISGMLKSK